MEVKNKGIEFQERLQPEVKDILNKQIYNELVSSHLYKAISSYFDNAGYVKLAKKFLEYGNEEQNHANKIIEYLYDRNCKVVIPDVPKQPDTYTDCRDVFTKSLEHEIQVTENWEDIAALCCEMKDSTTFNFADWFTNEQISEEDKFRKLLYYLNQGGTIWYLEQHVDEIAGE